MNEQAAGRRRALLAILLLCAASSPAFAHEGAGVAGGLLSGLAHPLTGMDHVLAMVAVGIWGAQLGRPAIWVLPVAFPLVMSVGGALGVRGVHLPGVEIGIAVSALLLGAMIAFAARPPLWAAAALVGLFAVFHGHAHGTELPHAANPLAYGVGFVIATGLLHLTGILLGVLQGRPAGAKALRFIGAGIGVAGGWLLAQLLL
jgi:urease accessory protein